MRGFNANLFITDIRQQRHCGVDRFADKLHMRRISRVHLGIYKQTEQEMMGFGDGSGITHTHTHTHLFNGPLSWTNQVSRYQKGKTNLDFIGARDSEWQWHQLGYMQVYTSLQTNNHASTPPLSFLQAGCPFCHPTNSVRALKA